MGDEDHTVTGLDERLTTLTNVEPPRSFGEIVIDSPHTQFITSWSELRWFAIAREAPGCHLCGDLAIRKIHLILASQLSTAHGHYFQKRGITTCTDPLCTGISPDRGLVRTGVAE